MPQDSTLSSRTNFTPEHICALIDLCLTTTYFQYSEGFCKQKHGWTMGSPNAANLYMEDAESWVLITFTVM